MGPEFGMIKDENEDPSSPKKCRMKKKEERNHTHEGTLSSAYRLMFCRVKEERERSIKRQKYKSRETEREREREEGIIAKKRQNHFRSSSVSSFAYF